MPTSGKPGADPVRIMAPIHYSIKKHARAYNRKYQRKSIIENEYTHKL